MSSEQKQEFKYGKRLLFSGIGGVAGAFTVYPLDLSKSILQDQKIEPGKPPMYKGIADVLKSRFAADGVRGIYRGLSVNIIGIIPEKATKFFVNDWVRAKLGCDSSEGCSIISEVFAGAVAGTTQQIFTVPMELFKIILQTRREGEAQKGLTQLVREAVAKKGIRGMYTGTAATLFRDIPFSMIYFSLYGYGKRQAEKQQEEKKPLGALKRLEISTIAGTIGAALATPMDVIKTRRQRSPDEYRTIAHTIRRIATEENPSAFFKGIGPRVLIIAPLFGIAMMTYETLLITFP